MNQAVDIPATHLPPDTVAAPSTTAAGKPLAHESARLHVAGEATYIDDQPELAGTLHAALGLSPVAHRRLLHIDVAGLKALPGALPPAPKTLCASSPCPPCSRPKQPTPPSSTWCRPCA